MKRITDLDIPLAYRTQANLWKAKYWEMRQEVVKANKGIKRLKNKLHHLTSYSSRAANACACEEPTISEKSYCTKCGRDMYPPPA